MEIKFDNVDAGRPFDWSRTSEDYARYRDIYPPVFYEKILTGISARKGSGCWIWPREPEFFPEICMPGVPDGQERISLRSRSPRRNDCPGRRI